MKDYINLYILQDYIHVYILVVIILFLIVFLICWIVGYWKIFQKAGKPGWHSFIPFLRTWDLFDISWNSNAAWVYLVLIIYGCVLNTVVETINKYTNEILYLTFCLTMIISGFMYIIMLYKLAKAYGKGFGHFIGLLLLNPISIIKLGLGDSKYQKNIKNTDNNNNNNCNNYSNYYYDNNYTNFSKPDYYSNANNTNNPQSDDKLEPW